MNKMTLLKINMYAFFIFEIISIFMMFQNFTVGLLTYIICALQVQICANAIDIEKLKTA